MQQLQKSVCTLIELNRNACCSYEWVTPFWNKPCTGFQRMKSTWIVFTAPYEHQSDIVYRSRSCSLPMRSHLYLWTGTSKNPKRIIITIWAWKHAVLRFNIVPLKQYLLLWAISDRKSHHPSLQRKGRNIGNDGS